MFKTLVSGWCGRKNHRIVEEGSGGQMLATKADAPTAATRPIDIPFDLGILVIADTHLTLRPENLSEAIKNKIDVCLLLGDIYESELSIIKHQIPPEIPMFGILGNHDSWGVLDHFGIEDISERVVQVKGVRIAGLSGSLRYKYVDVPMLTDGESCAITDEMPTADIFISHDSPKKIHARNDFAHSGLQGITYYCVKNAIPLNIHGHHHINKKFLLPNGTTSICCHGIVYFHTSNTDSLIQYTNKEWDNIEYEGEEADA